MDKEPAFTIMELSEKLKVSRQTIYNWINDFRDANPQNPLIIRVQGSSNVYSLTQVNRLLAFKNLATLEAEPVKKTVQAASIVASNHVKTASNHVQFDRAEYEQKLAATEAASAERAGNLNAAFVGFAKAEIEQALAEIRLTVKTMKANALAEMGVES